MTDITTSQFLRDHKLFKDAQERLRRCRGYLDQSRQKYSKEHGFSVPLTAEQCLEHIERQKAKAARTEQEIRV